MMSTVHCYWVNGPTQPQPPTDTPTHFHPPTPLPASPLPQPPASKSEHREPLNYSLSFIPTPHQAPIPVHLARCKLSLHAQLHVLSLFLGTPQLPSPWVSSPLSMESPELSKTQRRSTSFPVQSPSCLSTALDSSFQTWMCLRITRELVKDTGLGLTPEILNLWV